MANPLKTKWAAGEATLGAWLAMPSTVSAELMARLGFDWLTIDLQHGLIDFARMVEMLQAIGTTPTTAMVRVPVAESSWIGRVLDAGAAGVIVPLVDTADEARTAVEACRYPPRGRRSYGPFRAAVIAGGSYSPRADEDVVCLVMIETRDGLDNLDAILDVPGIDGVFVGPNDLSLALGLPPGGDHDERVFVEAIERIVAGCRARGLVAGCASTAAIAPKRLAQGFGFVEVSRDAAAMMRAASEDLRALRAVVAQAAGGASAAR
jgi:4-hydroxy-2-oxoheptanedioate aldolase